MANNSGVGVNNTLNPRKITGKFYALQNDEWLKVCQELKYAEVKVLFHLRTLEPFGKNNFKVQVIDIAKDTGLAKGTVSKALKRLDELGYIDLEVIEATIKLHTQRFPVGNRFPTEPSGFLQDHEKSYRKPGSSVGNQTGLEPLPCKGSKFSRYYIDLKRSLSEEERENFLNFVEQKTQDFDPPIIDLEAWLASPNQIGKSRCQIYYEKFQSTKPKQLIGPTPLQKMNAEIEQMRIAALKARQGEVS